MRIFRTIGACASVAVVLFFSAASVAYAAAPAHLLFADEFNGDSLDASTWVTLTPWSTRHDPGEHETFNPWDVAVQGGELHLISDRDVGGEFDSGTVTSLVRPQFSYGYFEIRARLPKGQGIWPAFWLTNDNTLEIDAFEVLGNQPTLAYMTLHENGPQVYQGTFDGPDFSAGYHTFAVDWQPTYVRWYIDGVQRAGYEHAMPSDPMWICLDTAVGGLWTGPPDATTVFPQMFDVDYVRVWDKNPHVVPPASPPAEKPAQAGGAVTGPKPTASAPSTPAASPPATAAAPSAAATPSASAAATPSSAQPARPDGAAVASAPPPPGPPVTVAVSSERGQTVPAYAANPLPTLSLGAAAYARAFRARGGSGD